MTATSSSPDRRMAPAFGDERIDPLRTALSHLFGAERRLRLREPQPGELTYGQVRCIGALGKERELTAGQLARSADLTPAAVTAILDQLETANIVQRRRSTSDRRVCIVSLTDAGWTLLERTLGEVRGLWADRLSEFSDAELATAIRVIDRVGGILHTLGSGDGPGRPPASADASPSR